MSMRLSLAVLLTASGLLAAPATAGVIGLNTPADSITATRIVALPTGERRAWATYYAKSQVQESDDRAALAAELKPGQPAPPKPEGAHGGQGNGMPLDRDAAWYGSDAARHVADVIVSFQTPAGGWSKNQNRAGALRLPGQPYASDNNSRRLTEDDFDAASDPDWGYVGTLDNGATITELRFLGKVAARTPDAAGKPYRQAIERGVRYLLNAQMPNGGWPQVWPLQGGYHDAVTFNDNAVSQAAALLTEVSAAGGDFAFLPAAMRAEAGRAAARARACILAAQIRVGGRLTGWGQQADPFTLEPVAGRNYEPPALASGESADLLLYLMSLTEPTPTEIAAVHAGVAWLKGAALRDKAWIGGKGDPQGRRLVDRAGAPPIWARYYGVADQRPVFGERDKTLRDDANELSLERRNGYAWFSTEPQKVIDAYAGWAKAHPAP
jgi:PelA/Pel-15E family pectate lyase